jgi:pimeloyl-ACP methyl ester carboxylesterase
MTRQDQSRSVWRFSRRGFLQTGAAADLTSPLAASATGRALDCGHFLQEERPGELTAELVRFFG